MEEIDKEDISHLHNQPDESSLLQELITQYLVHEGYRETAKTFHDEAQDSWILLGGSDSTLQMPEYEGDLDRQRMLKKKIERFRV